MNTSEESLRLTEKFKSGKNKRAEIRKVIIELLLGEGGLSTEESVRLLLKVMCEEEKEEVLDSVEKLAGWEGK